jgi:hypothetical protein
MFNLKGLTAHFDSGWENLVCIFKIKFSRKGYDPTFPPMLYFV